MPWHQKCERENDEKNFDDNLLHNFREKWFSFCDGNDKVLNSKMAFFFCCHHCRRCRFVFEKIEMKRTLCCSIESICQQMKLLSRRPREARDEEWENETVDCNGGWNWRSIFRPTDAQHQREEILLSLNDEAWLCVCLSVWERVENSFPLYCSSSPALMASRTVQTLHEAKWENYVIIANDRIP